MTGQGSSRSSMLRLVAIFSLVAVLAGCSARLDKDEKKEEKKDVPSAQLAAWSKLHAGPYDIPERALQSYSYSAAAMNKAAPACGIGWSTLAAIGWVLSDHGQTDEAAIQGDAMVLPRLRGLKQAQLKPVPDTDAGRFDGNSNIDWTMGPMQMLPSRWEQFATDADNDGVADPDNFDDATLTAARFLCAAGGDLRQTQGWTAAVGQFNAMPGFVKAVHDKATVYGR